MKGGDSHFLYVIIPGRHPTQMDRTDIADSLRRSVMNHIIVLLGNASSM